MGENTRLFFALWPDDAVRHALLHWQTHNLPSGLRWQHRADFHLTLHFLGVVDVDHLPALTRIGDRAPDEAFGLVLDEIGCWSRPGVMWCAPSSISAPLLELHRHLANGLAAAGFAVESRPFKPHVTLARKVKSLPDHQPLAPVTWAVREWALVASVPGDAPHYRCVRRWALN